MKKYEYKVELVPDLEVLERILNRRDSQGYEFIGQLIKWVYDGNQYTPFTRLIFRRSVDNEFYSDCSFKNYGKGVSK